MKILMLLESYFPPDIRVEKEARILIQAGHEVSLLSPGKEGAPGEEMFEGIRVIRAFLPKSLARRAWEYLWFKAFFLYPSWRKALVNTVKKHKIEVLHIHDLPLVKTGLSVARQFNIPLFADLHENYLEAIKVWREQKKSVPKRCIRLIWSSVMITI